MYQQQHIRVPEYMIDMSVWLENKIRVDFGYNFYSSISINLLANGSLKHTCLFPPWCQLTGAHSTEVAARYSHEPQALDSVLD